MRFYLDEDISPLIARLGRERGLDVTATQEYGRKGRGDVDQLHFAAAEGRCLVTNNCTDFEQFTSEFVENGWDHAGVLCLPRSIPANDYAAIVAALQLWEENYPEGVPPFFVGYLRRLPPGRNM